MLHGGGKNYNNLVSMVLTLASTPRMCVCTLVKATLYLIFIENLFNEVYVHIDAFRPKEVNQFYCDTELYTPFDGEKLPDSENVIYSFFRYFSVLCPNNLSIPPRFRSHHFFIAIFLINEDS